MTILKLPPSKSCKCRPATWKPAGAQSATDGRLAITCGKVQTSYDVMEFPADLDFDGRAFLLTKTDNTEAYNLLVSNKRSEWDSCDCAGHIYHAACKHLDAVRMVLSQISVQEDLWSDEELEQLAENEAIENRVRAGQTIRALLGISVAA